MVHYEGGGKKGLVFEKYAIRLGGTPQALFFPDFLTLIFSKFEKIRFWAKNFNFASDLVQKQFKYVPGGGGPPPPLKGVLMYVCDLSQLYWL